MVLADHGAAVVIEEKNYNKEALFEVLDDFYQHPEKLKEYSRHAYELAILDTADRIYQEICALLEQKSK